MPILRNAAEERALRIPFHGELIATNEIDPLRPSLCLLLALETPLE